MSPTSAVARPAGPEVAELAAAERRHATVMFVDLVGSTALAARLDPEDMREVFAAYQKCCAGLIASNCGFVAKYMGDGALAYFGYPQAHEDDAENAVRAALAIAAAAPNLNTAAGAPLHVRVGGAPRASWWSAIFWGPERAQAPASSCQTPQPRCAAAPGRNCRAKHGRHRRGHATPARQSLRASGPRGAGNQGRRRAGAGLGGAAGELGRKPLRGAARSET